MDYEKKLAQLEEIVKKLELGNLSLDEGVALFEEGVGVTKECLATLSQYKGRIAQIQSEMDALFDDEE